MTARWTVLVAEDNENDVLILEHAFSTIKTDITLKITTDGTHAIDYLSGRNGFDDRTRFPLPHLLLLDLKMPQVDGFGVLKWLRENPPLHRLRVIVFTSSAHHTDVDRAYDLGASSYIRKPADFADMKSVVACVKEWLRVNEFAIISEATYGSHMLNSAASPKQ
jgi:CheY-like chemotaxis protein